MLKKLLIGCFVALVVTAVAATAAVAVGGWAVSRWVSDLVGDADGVHGRELQRLHAAHPFAAPASGVFTESQLERFVAVCRRFAAFRERNAERFREMTESLSKSDDRVGWALFMLRFGAELRDELVAALVAQRMPLEEYRFLHAAVTKAALAGLGEQARQALLRPGAEGPTAELLRNVPDPALREALGELATVPAANLELARRHREMLEPLLPVAPMAGMLFPLLATEDRSPFW